LIALYNPYLHKKSVGKKMDNSTSSTWVAIAFYQPYFIGGVFALNALLSLGYLIHLLRYRAYNHMGGLISGVLLLTFLFSASRSLLIAQAFVREIQTAVELLDCFRTVSICSIFGLTFVAIVRCSESEFSKSYMGTKIACFMCILVNYGIAALSQTLSLFYGSEQLIPKAVQVACDMYFMTVLFIMGFAYIFMLPKTLSMGRNAKSTAAAPQRILTATLVALLSAVLLIAYVMFLLSAFITDRLKIGSESMGRWYDFGVIFRHVHLIGTAAMEAILTGLLVISAVLLIKTPQSSPEISPVSAPEASALLYPGRNTINATSYRSPVNSNGSHHVSLYKTDS
jgi:hypothetical protein